jgi:hypothetical protein
MPVVEIGVIKPLSHSSCFGIGISQAAIRGAQEYQLGRACEERLGDGWEVFGERGGYESGSRSKPLESLVLTQG